MDHIDPAVSETSHTVASWLLDIVDGLLNKLGLSHFETGEEIIYLAIVIAAALGIGWVIQKAVVFVLRRLVKMRNNDVGRELLQLRTISKCCHIIPPLVFLALAPFAFDRSQHIISVIERIAWIYVLVCFGIGLCAVLTFAFHHYDVHRNTKKLPIQGVLNLAQGIVWIIIIICAVGVAVDKSPAVLLTGLGAFSAALMLVFKDSILGFVAGIQMSQNDMVHVGDWIVVPGTPANGSVLSITLTAVKVQNWDNTIVTVPPYTLVSTSFQNYRGMSESGARRIDKTFLIDIPTVRRLTPAEVDALVESKPILKSFVDNLRKNNQTAQFDGGLTPINGTLDTNLGLFRAYLCEYVFNNPHIAKNQTILIRLSDPNASGLTLNVYCFTNTTDWDAYEAIQSALMEHITTVCGDFGLAIYTSGSLTVEQGGPATPPAIAGAPSTPDAPKQA